MHRYCTFCIDIAGHRKMKVLSFIIVNITIHQNSTLQSCFAVLCQLNSKICIKSNIYKEDQKSQKTFKARIVLHTFNTFDKANSDKCNTEKHKCHINVGNMPCY